MTKIGWIIITGTTTITGFPIIISMTKIGWIIITTGTRTLIITNTNNNNNDDNYNNKNANYDYEFTTRYGNSSNKESDKTTGVFIGKFSLSF